jgi:hypothetical protein
MEHNKEENTVQEIEHPVHIEERSMRRSTGNDSIFSVECSIFQAGKRDLATGISLLHEFESKTLNEKFLWNVWKQK